MVMIVSYKIMQLPYRYQYMIWYIVQNKRLGYRVFMFGVFCEVLLNFCS
jgi:hypothetical protein